MGRAPDEILAVDGTAFQINSEQVRYERRSFWIERKPVGAVKFEIDDTYDDTYDRRTAIRRMHKLAEAHGGAA